MKLKIMVLSTLVGLALVLIGAVHQMYSAGPATPFQLGRTLFWELVDLRSHGSLELSSTLPPGEFGLMSISPRTSTRDQG